MYLFDLGKLPGQQSMVVFHALARMGVEGPVIVSPQSPLAIASRIDEFYKERGIDSPGVEPQDMMRAILDARSK